MLSSSDRSESDFATYLAKQALAESGPYALEDGSRIAVAYIIGSLVAGR